MSELMYANIALALVNAVLALIVGAVYWRNHRQIHSPFTLALLLFAVSFVFHNGLVLYHYTTMMTEFYGISEVYLFVEGLLQAAGLGALVYATMQ